YVGAFSFAEVKSGYTAYFLGVRSICPNVTMDVKYTGSWSNQALEKEYNVNSASRNLGDTKNALKNNMKTAYNDILTLEAERLSCEKALEDAKNTYEMVKLNYELGNVTELTVKQTELLVLSAEMNLLQNAFNHDLKVFGLYNPSMLSASTQQ
ncbi:MAG: TolC family protein, partial [Firmicutes bacterium]|nr:TolC family protein [Bacillota bacterium]